MEGNQNISFHLYGENDRESNWLEGLEVCYVLRGSGFLSLSHAKQWDIHENDIFVINLYEMYQLLPGSAALVLSLFIPEHFVLNLYPELEHMDIDCHSFLFGTEGQKHFDKIRKAMADIFAVYSKNDVKVQLRTRGLVAFLLSELMSSFGKIKEREHGRNGREQLRLMTEYVRQHYQEDISLKKFAEQNYFSVSHLAHLSKSELGLTFTEYLTSVRLQHAVFMLRQQKSVTETAEKVGFVNSNAFIKAFHNRYGVTPGKYRNEQQKMKLEESTVTNHETDFLESRSYLFATLFSYLEENELKDSAELEIHEPEVCQLTVDLGRQGKRMSENWKYAMNGGYAKGLRAQCIREVICKVQDEIGFRYIRCKGIFDNELQICTRDASDRLVFNYVYLDEILDFILSCHARPWLELSFMPEALCRRTSKRKGDIWLVELPDNRQEWLMTVERLLIHLKERYGEKEISNWIVTPFADTFMVKAHMREKTGYYEFYEDTYRLIRAVIPYGMIAARGEFESDGNGLGDFMLTNRLLPDMWTMVQYNSISPSEEESELNLVESMEAYSMVTSSDTEYLEHQITLQKKELEKHDIGGIPLILAEWNSTIWQRDLCNDIAYKSCYLLKNILENYNNILGFTYWHISDWNYEYLPSPYRFHGGFGLFTQDGIPKAAYGALQLLNLAEGDVVKRGKGYFILRSEGKFMIYLYHFCPYDMLYRYRHVREMDRRNRYGVFEARNDMRYRIRLKNVEAGSYRKKIYSIGPKGGSACDAWMQMGGPEDMDQLERNYILAASVPVCWSGNVEVSEDYVVQSILEPHEIQLMIFQKN